MTDEEFEDEEFEKEEEVAEKTREEIAEEEFQKLPLKEKQELVSVFQTWNKAFEYGFNYAKKAASKENE